MKPTKLVLVLLSLLLGLLWPDGRLLAYRDLETGEFLTRDPAGFVDGPNLYTYVRQNPWTKFDPEGLHEEIGGAPRVMPDGSLQRSQPMIVNNGRVISGGDIMNPPQTAAYNALNSFAAGKPIHPIDDRTLRYYTTHGYPIEGIVGDLNHPEFAQFKAALLSGFALGAAANTSATFTTAAPPESVMRYSGSSPRVDTEVKPELTAKSSADNSSLTRVQLGLDGNLMAGKGAYYTGWGEIIGRPFDAGSPGEFARAFKDATTAAHEINFNLTGITDVQDAYARGANGFGRNNYTNAELHSIMSNPKLLEKTNFYNQGKPVSKQDVLNRVNPVSN